MKKVLLFFITLFMTGLYGQAQTAQGANSLFAQEGKVWEMQVGGIKENIYANRIEGDTLIKGETWKKVVNSLPWGIGATDSYFAAIRNVGQKVYAIARGSSRQRLLYDFGLNVGDVVGCGVEGNAFCCLLDESEQPDTLLGFPFVAYLRVEHADTVEAQGMKHRRLVLSVLTAFKEQLPWNGIIWVEGIGSSAGPFLPWLPAAQDNNVFLECHDGEGHVLFGQSDFQSNVLSHISGVSSQSEESKVFYDLQGRQLQQQPRRGLYIERGRKRMR